MKKYVLVLMLLGSFSFFSCNNDDDNANREEIVGNWILESVTPSTAFDPSECANNSTVKVNGDNTLQANFYFVQNNCDGTSGDGTWTNTGNSTYTIVFPGFGELQGTVNFTSADNFTFTTDDSVLTFIRQL